MQVIYVGRNVKDICVSSFYHARPDTNFSKYVFRSLNAPMSHSHILHYRWAEAFKNGEVMVGNWFEHMREVTLRNILPQIMSFVGYCTSSEERYP